MPWETVGAFTDPEGKRRAPGPTVKVLLVVAIVSGVAYSAAAQSTSTTELWPAVRVNIDLHPRIGLQFFADKQNGEELPKAEVKAGAKVSYRVKPLFKHFLADIDAENQYLVTAAVGYEYLRKSKNGQPSNENRLFIESTPRYAPGAGFLFLNRHRMEFRWIDGKYNFRYRLKVTAQRDFKVDRFRFTPYASGELFWDRNHHEWNQNQYAFGVQLPYKKRLMLDTYVLHQNCTTCVSDSVNVFGVSLNLYFRRSK